MTAVRARLPRAFNLPLLASLIAVLSSPVDAGVGQSFADLAQRRAQFLLFPALNSDL